MPHVSLSDVIDFLHSFAPLSLAADWDNVGLLIGDRNDPVERIVTCLTLTEDVVDEAIAEQTNLIVSHHPLMFRPVQRITDETPEGRTLLKLFRGGIAVYSPHTAFDSAKQGINQQLAESLSLSQIRPLRPADEDETHGEGRMGDLAQPQSLADFLLHIRELYSLSHVAYTGDPQQQISRVAIGCGSAGEFLRDAVIEGCDLFLTGETRFHTHLEARATGIALVLLGHYASERPAVEALATTLSEAFPDLTIWPSRVERDPVQWSSKS